MQPMLGWCPDSCGKRGRRIFLVELEAANRDALGGAHQEEIRLGIVVGINGTAARTFPDVSADHPGYLAAAGSLLQSEPVVVTH